MSNLTQVLFGNRLYSAATFEENYDPQTLLAGFNDTQTPADATGFGVATTLVDAQSLLDGPLVRSVGKALAEITLSSPNLFGRPLFGSHTYSGDMIDPAIYMREEAFKRILKSLRDAISAVDTTVAIHQTKGFTDFTVLREWFGIRLLRTGVWSDNPGFHPVPSTFSLFGRPLFAQKLYSATPVVSWYPPVADTAAWSSTSSESSTTPTLFGRTVFGLSLFSDKPVVMWAGTIGRSENWTNSDGNNNQEV